MTAVVKSTRVHGFFTIASISEFGIPAWELGVFATAKIERYLHRRVPRHDAPKSEECMVFEDCIFVRDFVEFGVRGVLGDHHDGRPGVGAVGVPGDHRVVRPELEALEFELLECLEIVMRYDRESEPLEFELLEYLNRPRMAPDEEHGSRGRASAWHPGTAHHSRVDLAPCTGAMCCPWDPCTAEVCMASPRLH